MKIYKDPNTNDTCLAHEAPEGWVEIDQQELDAIRESRRIQRSAQELVAEKIAPVKVLRETAINRINGIADREMRAGNATIRAVGDSVVLALLAMTKNLPADPALVDEAITERYAAIVAPLAQTAPELLSAFAEMDQ